MAHWEMQVDCDTTARTWRMCGEVMAAGPRQGVAASVSGTRYHPRGDTISQGCEAFIMGYHAAFRPGSSLRPSEVKEPVKLGAS